MPQCETHIGYARVHVALNALFLEPGITGGAEFMLRRLVPALLAADPSLLVTILTARHALVGVREMQFGPRCEIVGLPISGASRVRRTLVEQAVLPKEVSRSGAELLHNLATTAPAFCSVPQVTTILDLNYRHTRSHAPVRALGIAGLARLAVRASTRVLTISQYVADDIANTFRMPIDRIDVAWLGPGIDPTEHAAASSLLRKWFRLSTTPLLLCPASARPNKNVPRLIEAFACLRHPAQLVLTGVTTGFEDEVERAVSKHRIADRVHRVGWVDDSALAGLYAIADLVVFPSLAEGFGLPLVEAMGRGVPVACSSRTSLPEVGGDAVAYFDPESVADMASVLNQLLADPQRRADLAAAGRRRATLFSWDRTAEATLASYRRALDTPVH